jgi:hypothetical protein
LKLQMQLLNGLVNLILLLFCSVIMEKNSRVFYWFFLNDME